MANAWIAVRHLKTVSRPHRTLAVKIGKPEPHRGYWRCAFCVSGAGVKARTRYAYGVDSMQALMLTFVAVRGLLAAGPRVSWLSGKAGDNDFPMHAPTFYGLAFQRRVERMMERETKTMALRLIAAGKRRKAGKAL